MKYVTGADITASGSMIVVRSYEQVLMWPRRADALVEEAMSSVACPVSDRDERQGEAVTFGANGDHYITVSEGSYPAVWYFRFPVNFQSSLLHVPSRDA